ncbi:MAG: peptide deformylase [Actinomycetota bacterium]|nr:peptide deformylase [Actinomycetota bacterium]
MRLLGDPVLREKCIEVAPGDPEMGRLTRTMGATLHASEGRVGLAAPQIGSLKKMFVYDVGYGVRCFINPSIIDHGDEVMVEEGCLSLPGIYVTIPRYRWVKLSCMLLSRHHVVFEAEGFLAQVIQHECDHLHGILMIDHLSPEDRKKALEEYQELTLQKQWQNS